MSESPTKKMKSSRAGDVGSVFYIRVFIADATSSSEARAASKVNHILSHLLVKELDQKTKKLHQTCRTTLASMLYGHVRDYLLDEGVVIQSLYIADRFGDLYEIRSLSNYSLTMHNSCIFEDILNAFVFTKPKDSPSVVISTNMVYNFVLAKWPEYDFDPSTSGYCLDLAAEITESTDLKPEVST